MEEMQYVRYIYQNVQHLPISGIHIAGDTPSIYDFPIVTETKVEDKALSVQYV